MKELSIEEKARRYDEALDRARKIHNEHRAQPFDVMLKVFPELKEESEDDSIRKELIRAFKSLNTIKVWNGIERTDILTWLEKQGEQNPTDKVEPKDYNSIDPHFGKPVDFKAEHFYVSKVDGKIHDMTYNSADKVEPKFKIGDIIRFKGNKTLKGEAETHKIVGYDNESYVFADGTTDLFCEQDLYELVEQKSTDKVEPKFHKGEWVVFNDKHEGVYQIKKIENFQYTLRHILGGSMPLSFSHEDMIRPWTIQDAKGGDVIYLPNGNNEYYLFIFKGIENAAVMSFAHFYQYDDGSSEVEGTIDNLSSVNDVFQPATNEQRDLLFQKMREAGYEWDAKKKELKEIEKQPLQWNISDYRTWQYIVSDVLTKHDGIGQYIDDGFCKKIAKYMQEEWSKRLMIK